uniref:Uncharacterized protein n=1 Tax=Fibrocapsa japonica TaxID=94617 RepID=A0A7S2US55_9STRA|mmetsp:Transcript_10444/g.15618  ORF Transcript_10444/g.15618 Transcript_10444/m.15618 type:complete len:460 (+) Transcript_10444:131-1510(+)
MDLKALQQNSKLRAGQKLEKIIQPPEPRSELMRKANEAKVKLSKSSVNLGDAPREWGGHEPRKSMGALSPLHDQASRASILQEQIDQRQKSKAAGHMSKVPLAGTNNQAFLRNVQAEFPRATQLPWPEGDLRDYRGRLNNDVATVIKSSSIKFGDPGAEVMMKTSLMQEDHQYMGQSHLFQQAREERLRNRAELGVSRVQLGDPISRKDSQHNSRTALSPLGPKAPQVRTPMSPEVVDVDPPHLLPHHLPTGPPGGTRLAGIQGPIPSATAVQQDLRVSKIPSPEGRGRGQMLSPLLGGNKPPIEAFMSPEATLQDRNLERMVAKQRQVGGGAHSHSLGHSLRNRKGAGVLARPELEPLRVGRKNESSISMGDTRVNDQIVQNAGGLRTEASQMMAASLRAVRDSEGGLASVGRDARIAAQQIKKELGSSTIVFGTAKQEFQTSNHMPNWYSKETYERH